MKRIIFALAFLIGSAQAAPIALYSVDFEAPTHTAGAAPTVGLSSATPSSISFGQPRVTNGFAALPGQSLVFNTAGNAPSFYYDQIQFDLDPSQTHYQVGFRASSQGFVATGSSNLFTLLLDTSAGVQSLTFWNTGAIRLFSTGGSPLIGSFSDNSLVDVLIDVDLLANQWEISLGGVLVHVGGFAQPGAFLNSLRFSFGSNTANTTTTFDSFGLDNVQITAGTVASPSAGLLALIGLLTMLSTRKRNAV